MVRKKLLPAPAMRRPEWLPEGWSVEYRKRRFSNAVDKYYIHPFSAKKLRSKPEVMRFLSKTPTDVDHTAFRKAVTYQKSHKAQDHKPLVQVDHCPSDLPEGWIVEKRHRRRCRYKGQTDSYYIDPIYGRKFRSKTEVSRYLNSHEARALGYRQKRMHIQDNYSSKEEEDLYYIDPVYGHKFCSKKKISWYQSNQEIYQNPYRKGRMHTPDCHLLKHEDALPLIEFKKSKARQAVIRKHLILEKEQTLIEYIKSKVKRTVTRRRLILTKETVSSAGTLQNPAPSLPLKASTQRKESKSANLPPKQVPQLSFQASTQLEANSAANCTTVTIEDIKNLEQNMRNIRIQCHENRGGSGKGSDLRPLEGKWLDLRQKQPLKRKAAAEYELPSKYVKRLNAIQPDSDYDLSTVNVAMIGQDYEREMAIPSELEEKLGKLQICVEQASDTKCEDISDELLEKLGKPVLPRACAGDLWLDPCIEFAFKTLTSDFFVLENMPKTCMYPNS